MIYQVHTTQKMEEDNDKIKIENIVQVEKDLVTLQTHHINKKEASLFDASKYLIFRLFLLDLNQGPSD